LTGIKTLKIFMCSFEPWYEFIVSTHLNGAYT